MEELLDKITQSTGSVLIIESNPNIKKKCKIFEEILKKFVPAEYEKMWIVCSDLESCQQVIKRLGKKYRGVVMSCEERHESLETRVENMKIDGGAGFTSLSKLIEADKSGGKGVQECLKEFEVVVCSQFFLFRKGVDYVDSKALLVFEDAIQLDVKAIDYLSVNIDLKLISSALGGVNDLLEIIEIKRMEDDLKLKEFYEDCKSGNLGKHLDAKKIPRRIPVLELASTKIPGVIRKPEFFLKMLKKVCVFIRQTLRTLEPSINSCTYFLYNLYQTWLVPSEYLTYFSVLFNTLANTLGQDIYQNPNLLSLYIICEFCSLSACSPDIYSIIYEPYPETTNQSPILQLSCQNPSQFFQDLFSKFSHKVLFTSSYSQILSQFLGSSEVLYFSQNPEICSLILTRGSDQLFLSTKSDEKIDDGVIRNYGEILLELSEIIPDGLVAIFPEWKTLISYINKWNESGVLLRLLENKLLFIENTENEQKLLKSFLKACECGRGGIFLMVAREKCIEKLNKFGRLVKCSLIFGVPQGGIVSRVLRSRLIYLKKIFGIDEGDYLNFDAMRDAVWAVTQGLKGAGLKQAVIFVDRRFDSVQKKLRIPKWILDNFKSKTSVAKDSAKDVCCKYFKSP